MSGWFVGQKIVCVNVDPIGSSYVEADIKHNLKVGVVYVIKQVVAYTYTHEGKKQTLTAFRLAGIVCSKAPDLETGKFVEYAFWEGRFQPLEENKDELKVDVPEQMKNWLKDVNEGKVFFEEEKELEKVDEDVS